MAGHRRLYLYWDPALDAEFRRRLEQALGRLNLDTSDGDAVDRDPDNPGIAMAIAAAAGGWLAPTPADIFVQGGPGTFPAAGSSVLRIEARDIEQATQAWRRLVEQLRAKLGMASLDLSADELAVRLDEAGHRLETAERAMSTAQLAESTAIRERNALQVQLAEAHKALDGLKAEIVRLSQISEAGAFTIGAVPPDRRAAVIEAREHAWRAQESASRAADAAGRFPDSLVWGRHATYAGEHRNNHPDGYGVIIFGAGVAWYRGAFAGGKRNGHGVGQSHDGLVWSGMWKDDEACGPGVLESPDGCRFEGRVAPAGPGALKAETGWMWTPAKVAGQSGARRTTVHRPAPLTLPSPADRAAGRDIPPIASS